MNKEPIYRIKIEVIGEEKADGKLDETLRGVDCNGFVILCDKGDRCTSILHNVTNIDIAHALAGNGNLMAASMVAQAMRECRKYIQEERNPLADFLKAIPSNAD